MASKNILKAAQIFRLLADPTRLKILELLFRSKKKLCVHEIAEIVGVSQSATSHQLAKLESRGIVNCFRLGQMMCYEINQSSLAKNVRDLLVLAK